MLNIIEWIRKRREYLTPVYLPVKALFEVQSTRACLVLQLDKVLSQLLHKSVSGDLCTSKAVSFPPSYVFLLCVSEVKSIVTPIMQSRKYVIAWALSTKERE